MNKKPKKVILVPTKGITLVLMHTAGIVHGYQLLCNAHTVLEPHRGTAAFKNFTHYHSFLLFFICVCHSDNSILLFFVASIICVNNLKRTADLVLWTSICTLPWHQNYLIVFMVPLNLTLLNS